MRDDRSLLDCFTADYTFVNERLASTTASPNVTGPQFRRVTLTDPNRRGILGQGSILLLTSIADRTSPVLRGKWVMEVLLGVAAAAAAAQRARRWTTGQGHERRQDAVGARAAWKSTARTRPAPRATA